MSETNQIVKQINEAFKMRYRPEKLIASDSLTSFEIDEVNQFCVDSYSSISERLLDDNYEVLSAVTPDAFAYYLPMVIKYSLENHSIDNMSADSIIGYIDRSDKFENWEEFFVKRWSLFSTEELSSIEEWMIWFSGEIKDEYFESKLTRGFDVIQELKRGCSGVASPLFENQRSQSH